MFQPRPSRRRFLRSVAALTAAAIYPGYVLGKSEASQARQFRFAQIGCGGQGAGDMGATISGGGHLAAMCDVDSVRAAKSFAAHPDVPKFTDFRKMLDKMEKEIDGVVVSTPDHVHAVAALDAIRRGKHVYVEKPLARTFEECQVLLEAAKKHRVATQMGNQGHAGSGLLLWQKMFDAGAFGDIEQVHTWSDRPIWPQGMTAVPKPDEVPATLDWESWIGPQTMRPYAKSYLPFSWRGWWDFGCGAMGDMACHNMDPAFWVLKLGLPSSVKAQVSAPVTVAYPAWSIIEYTFPATTACPKPIKLTWYDGKKLPTAPADADPELKIGGNGCMFVGSKLTARGGSHASPPQVISITGQAFGGAVKDAEQHWAGEGKQLHGTNHHKQWIDAALAGNPDMPGSKFEYAAPMTQAILLGCIALRFPGTELQWDASKQEFSNSPEANRFLKYELRPGYDLTV